MEGREPEKELSARRTRSVVPGQEEGFHKVTSRLAEGTLRRARTEENRLNNEVGVMAETGQC